jgi:TetR/AcrR family transcriptional repressor of nem operon
MRYSKEHKAQAKAAILRESSRALKESGFHAIGVDALAAAASVTSGALYSNFEGKEALLEEVVAAQVGREFAPVGEDDAVGHPAEQRRRLAEVLRMYLSREHRENPADGCVMPALSVDVARSGDAVRQVYGQRMTELVALLGPATGSAPGKQDDAAWLLIASIVGAVTIARALPDGKDAQSVLSAVLEESLRRIDEADD